MPSLSFVHKVVFTTFLGFVFVHNPSCMYWISEKHNKNTDHLQTTTLKTHIRHTNATGDRIIFFLLRKNGHIPQQTIMQPPHASPYGKQKIVPYRHVHLLSKQGERHIKMVHLKQVKRNLSLFFIWKLNIH